MKKLIYKIILIAIIVFWVLFIVEKVVNSPTTVLSRSYLKSYIKTYLNEYKRLLELVPAGYKERAIFFTPYYRIEGIISLTHGASVKLSVSDKEMVKITVVKEKIEKIISPNARYPGRMIVDGISFRFINNPLPTFNNIPEGNTSEFTILNDSGRDQISNRQLDLKNDSEVFIYDGNNQIIVKESNYKKAWTKEIAIRDATSELMYQIRNSILEKSKMNNIAASVEFEKLNEEIRKKEYKGNKALLIYDNIRYLELTKKYNMPEAFFEYLIRELKSHESSPSFLS